MAQIEPMDIDSINNEFDNKENSVHHNNVLPHTPSTEKGYEELDVSELNMKLRYSITPASSPMSKSLTVNSLENRTFDSEDFINNVVINENCNLTRSLNSTITRNDTAKSLRSLPLQVLSTELVTESRSASVLRIIDPTLKVQDNNVTITFNGENYIDDNISLPSTSSSVAQTPEATTPTKEIQKHDGGSPIMRGLKSVLNMFRSSQSPIPPADVLVKQEILSPNETVSNIEGHKSQQATASTPISNKVKEVNGSQRSSPLKESIVFNDDLERELQWKDETTILFKEEKIPIHKLLLPQSISSISKTSETASSSMKVEKENLNVSVEPMDISNNDSILDVEMAKHIQSGVMINDLIIESDGEFVDCETTINNDISDNKIMENLTHMDHQNTTLQQSYNVLINNKQSIDSSQSDTFETSVKDYDLSTNYNKNETNRSNEQQRFDQERQADSFIKDHDVMPIAATPILIEDQNTKSSHNIDEKSNAVNLRQSNEIDPKNSNGLDNIDANNFTFCKDIKSEETISDLKLPSDIPLPDEDDVDCILNCENNNTFNISNPIQQDIDESITTVEQQKINETVKDQKNESIVHNEMSIIKESYSQCEDKEAKDFVLDCGNTSDTKAEAISQIVNEETMAILNIDQDIDTKDAVEIIGLLDKQKQIIENIYMSETNSVTLITERNLETNETITDSLEINSDVNTKTVCASEKFDGEEKIYQNINENVMSVQDDQSMFIEDANKILVKNETNTMIIENLKNDKSVSVSTRNSSQTFGNSISFSQNDNQSQLHYSEDNDISVDREITKIVQEISSEVSNELNFEKLPQHISSTKDHTASISDSENITNNTSDFKDNDDTISDVNMDNLQKSEDELNKTLNVLTDKFASNLQKTCNTVNSVEYTKAENGINNDEKVCLIGQENVETILNEVTNTVEENCVSRLESQMNSNELSMNTTLNMSIDQESDIENKETKTMANECHHDTDVINSNIFDRPNIVEASYILIPSESIEYTVNKENVLVSTLEVDSRVTSDDINANPGDKSEEKNTVSVHSAEQITDIPTALKCENSHQVILSPERENSSLEISSDYNKPQLNLVSVEADVIKQKHEFINTSEALNYSTKIDCKINNQAISDVTPTVDCESSGDNNEDSTTNTHLEQSASYNPCINLNVLKSENNTEAILLPEQSNSASKNSSAINQVELNVISAGEDATKQKHEVGTMGKSLIFSRKVDCDVIYVEAEQGEKIENTPLNNFQDFSPNKNDIVGSETSSGRLEKNLDVNDREKAEIKSQVSPPVSPVISSKGYNFNFDEIDDPFATKTKIRLSPPPEDVPRSPERAIKQSISTNTKKDLQKRKSLPEIKRQSFVKNKIRSSLSDAVDNNEEIKKCTNTPELIEVAVMNSTIVNTLNVNSHTSETLAPNSLKKDELVQPIQLAPRRTNETGNNTDTSENNENFIINKDQLTGTSTLADGAEITLNISEQNMLSESKHEPKNVFNLPEMSTDMNFKSFVTKSNICRSPIPELNICTSSFKAPTDLSDYALKSVDCTYSENNFVENVDKKHTTTKADNDSSTASSSSKTNEDAPVREVNTEDEDTVEGPFYEADDLNDDDKISDYVPDNEDMMHFTDMLAQGTDDNVDSGEMFIDAEAFEFLLNQNKSNVVVDSGKESLFLKFDPLFAKRMSSDGVLAALNKVQKRQSTPKRISKAPTVDFTYCDKMSPGPLNATTDVNNTLENNFEDPNTTVSKPMMVVNPAINSIISPRNKTITTPPRANRRSLTFTSPAIAVIDRLLSLSGNNSALNHEAPTTPVRREQNETDVALTQLRELLAEKEIHVHNLRLESKELKERLSTLETQVHSLESESEQRLRKIKELNERLVEKTNINKSMAAVVEEYERTIASLIAETEQDKKRHAEERMRLINERDEQTAHLASMEISFNDLHSKYEKSKQVILSCKANEDTYRRSIKEFEESLLKMQKNYELLKQHASSKLNHANQELEKLNKAHEAEVLKLNAMIKRKELHITSLEETLAQKTKANEELTAICDELINKVG